MKNITPKFPFINGLWIDHTHDLFPKLTSFEESFIVCYQCRTTLIKLRYSNNILIGLKALKGNISIFAQTHDAAMALIDSLPTSLKSFSGICNLRFF
jgi:hypothetical protein